MVPRGEGGAGGTVNVGARRAAAAARGQVNRPGQLASAHADASCCEQLDVKCAHLGRCTRKRGRPRGAARGLLASGPGLAGCQGPVTKWAASSTVQAGVVVELQLVAVQQARPRGVWDRPRVRPARVSGAAAGRAAAVWRGQTDADGCAGGVRTTMTSQKRLFLQLVPCGHVHHALPLWVSPLLPPHPRVPAASALTGMHPGTAGIGGQAGHGVQPSCRPPLFP